ncbi:homoserine kinase [Clostridium pasteurianum DSM 525 = ATCC 6013]|uniref:Homoserine kinase n=1 Tax=Clostridium pasteurianum DSM 525 = ATCC 6013 TaxID=1262449 RepID=A0A0H3J3R3_CLOPA|nr:homoserine kinase [Clostridium pasteurianum]AJA47487.1 homoserine kinase [Clostridium pasteurianum DSM 525 = ATCC 6013]AJA51475.1 homoserine kinase [Clostridium pasteurianum DSM 525 = ATCC 6013]AOZ74806.1 homoserine kinase [Clostridium pasteurianum DSM 525 = ATCC 6013]AOZ78602.1 homoserine kinase [Clostridium pasteurianum]ELP57677.1 homoserine kinase [Clostridium pasteurianum DSM 525 = ATCC 6013]
MLKVKVPASTANMGPGFDSFGMALNLYNEFQIKETDKDIIFLENGEPSSIPLNENLIYNSMIKAFQKHKYKFKGLYINVTKADVPLSRGLGSSATCIAAGIKAANHIMGNIMPKQEILNLATEIEGHPDNVVAALEGGFDVSLVENNQVLYSKITPPEELVFAALIPNFKMSTLSGRKVLPDKYDRKDCVFNISRAALLISVFYNKDFEKLRTCFQDKIHQPYRGESIKNLNSIFETAKRFGSLGEFISGSGSTLMTVIHKDNIDFLENMKNYLKTMEVSWEIKLLKPDCNGTEITVCQ